MIIGGLVVAAIAVWYLFMGNGPGNSPLGQLMGGGKGPRTTSPDYTDRDALGTRPDAMYAGYY